MGRLLPASECIFVGRQSVVVEVVSVVARLQSFRISSCPIVDGVFVFVSASYEKVGMVADTWLDSVRTQMVAMR